MRDPRNLPDLGAINRAKASENGGANLAAIDKKYAVGLTTPDGVEHVYVFQMGRPVGPDGQVDLGALAQFNPARDALTAVVERIGGAWYGDPRQNPIVIQVVTGEMVVLRHVISIRFLGAADDLADRNSIKLEVVE